ncbi:MAG TPA: pyrroloquinoline-quinone synthase PqqC [Methylomirabilota bacterium]|nr:pyrroloquinoline-quinone synthase PqqC [Methylomirabilota bacterium]
MATDSHPLSTDEFTRRLRAVGAAAYHDKHPFHQLMHQGKLTRRQVQAWIENRFYYQAMIPRKDAAIISKATDQNVRRAWIQRVIDQDGGGANEGGIHKWLALAEAAGLNTNEVENFRYVLPAVRFAVDAYLNLVESRPLEEAIASSLTEMFAPAIMSERLPAFEQHYPWIEKDALEYFRTRLVQAPRDVEFGLRYTLEHCVTRRQQEKALEVLRIKCHILWSLLDAVHFAYVTPALLPPLFPTDGDSQ